MSFLSDIGGGITKALTGVDSATLQAQVDVAEQNLQIAVEAQITLSAIAVFELAVIIILLWKKKAV